MLFQKTGSIVVNPSCGIWFGNSILSVEKIQKNILIVMKLLLPIYNI